MKVTIEIDEKTVKDFIRLLWAASLVGSLNPDINAMDKVAVLVAREIHAQQPELVEKA